MTIELARKIIRGEIQATKEERELAKQLTFHENYGFTNWGKFAFK